MGSVQAPRPIPLPMPMQRVNLTGYMSTPGSDNGSSGAGQNASDSAYMSRCADSHTSHSDPKDCSQETEVQDIPTQLEGFRPVTPTVRTMQNNMSTPVVERPSSRVSLPQTGEIRDQEKCPHCSTIPKCPSDLK
jgi:hypothetical protein